jgi:hypothetical protein
MNLNDCGYYLHKALRNPPDELSLHLENCPISALYLRRGTNHSGSYDRDILTELVEHICPSHGQYMSEDFDVLWYVNTEHPCADQQECNRIARGIYWLLFHRGFKASKKHIHYLEHKVLYQRLYAYHTPSADVVPLHIYKFMRLVRTLCECAVEKINRVLPK